MLPPEQERNYTHTHTACILRGSKDCPTRKKSTKITSSTEQEVHQQNQARKTFSPSMQFNFNLPSTLLSEKTHAIKINHQTEASQLVCRIKKGISLNSADTNAQKEAQNRTLSHIPTSPSPPPPPLLKLSSKITSYFWRLTFTLIFYMI